MPSVHSANSTNLNVTLMCVTVQVDLILHPLKSELNWPLGKKRPLDMTRNRPGSQLGDGIRWLIPFHLLDALFYCSEGRAVIDIAFQDSRRAKSVLESIKVYSIV
jgi:hypothetical protein